MAHMITEKDKVAYSGERPWHGIGQQVDGVMTATEAIMKANLGWKVIEQPIFNQGGIQIPKYKAILREDTGDLLQIAGEGYKVIQNSECFTMFDEVVGTGQAKYEVAGSLQGGKKIWMLARVPYDFSVLKGKDEVRSYCTLINGHDGSLALWMYETPIRTVCWNTMRASFAARTASVSARHTDSAKKSFVSRAQVSLEKARAYFLQMKEAAEHLAAKQMTEFEIDCFLKELFEVEDAEKVSTRKQNIIDEVKALTVRGIGTDIPGVTGTAWGTWNAVTEYIDWHRGGDDKVDQRMTSSWLGAGADLRQKAFELLVK